MIDTISSKTFHFNGLVIDLHPEVYEPAEDSFLLIEALKINYGDKILEIGTGCGLIALECARCGAQVICTDVNPFAVQLAHHNSKRNCQMLKGTLEVRDGDLFSTIKERELFDIVIFNPPYLPASDEKKVCGWLDVATDGGKDGVQVTKRFIEGIKKYLSQNGRAYFVFSSLSDMVKLEKYLDKERLTYEIVLSQQFDFEVIDIYCVTPKYLNQIRKTSTL